MSHDSADEITVTTVYLKVLNVIGEGSGRQLYVCLIVLFCLEVGQNY